MSCRRRRGYRRFSTSAYRLLGDFEVAITGGVWVATGVVNTSVLGNHDFPLACPGGGDSEQAPRLIGNSAIH